MLDKNGDGVLSKDELIQGINFFFFNKNNLGFSKLGIVSTDPVKEIEEIMKYVDVDND